MAFGEVFAPTTDNAQMATRGGQRAQGPLRTLSFQLPQTGGGQPRAGSSVGHAVLQSVLRTVLGHDAASTMAGSPAAPRVSGGAPGGMGGGMTGGMPAPRDPGMSVPDFSGGAPSPMGQPRASRMASTGAPDFGITYGEENMPPVGPSPRLPRQASFDSTFDPTSPYDMAHVEEMPHYNVADGYNKGVAGGRGIPNSDVPAPWETPTPRRAQRAVDPFGG